MSDFEYTITPNGIRGVLPSGEIDYFSSVDSYRHAYEFEENDIIDGLAELYEDNVIDFPEDWAV